MNLDDTTDRARQTAALVACAHVTLELAGRDEVRAAWADESSCSGLTVGGLTHHLVNQIGHVARGLSEPAPLEAPIIGLLDHYSRAPWVQSSRQGAIDPDQNATDNAAAEVGHAAVLLAASESLTDLADLVDRPRDPDVIHIPWQGWSLSTSDYCVTRMMEMVVHGDDLAASVGLATPEHDPVVVESVLGLLGAVALRRHGQVALVRALSRPQRSTGDVSAF